MKKTLVSGLILLAFASSAVLASNDVLSPNQCPPASALTHKGFGAHWVISDTYKKLGWYVSSFPWSDMVPNTFLNDNVYVDANIISNEDDNNWFVTCQYDVHTGAFPRYVTIAKNGFLKGEPPIPNFSLIETGHYQCMGESKQLNCSWDSIAK